MEIYNLRNAISLNAEIPIYIYQLERDQKVKCLLLTTDWRNRHFLHCRWESKLVPL